MTAVQQHRRRVSLWGRKETPQHPPSADRWAREGEGEGEWKGDDAEAAGPEAGSSGSEGETEGEGGHTHSTSSHRQLALSEKENAGRGGELASGCAADVPRPSGPTPGHFALVPRLVPAVPTGAGECGREPCHGYR
jgi:hypothetical protein